MLNIVIVEDHRNLRESLQDVMTSDGHSVAAFGSAEAMWSACDLATTDILILDLNLPGEDGISVARRVRALRPETGIVMLTARGEPEERKIGYDSGADIYLAKPSSGAELSASIHALARRLNRGKPELRTLTLDTVEMTLTGPDDSVALSPSEVELLTQFARAPDNRLMIDRITEIAGRNGELSKAAIEVRIVRLRKKIIAAGAIGQPIKVERNLGYRLSTRVNLA